MGDEEGEMGGTAGAVDRGRVGWGVPAGEGGV